MSERSRSDFIDVTIKLRARVAEFEVAALEVCEGMKDDSHMDGTHAWYLKRRETQAALDRLWLLTLPARVRALDAKGDGETAGQRLWREAGDEDAKGAEGV